MKIVEIFFKSNKKFKGRDAEKLRGFMAHHFSDIIEFHNHKDELSFNYKSSIIQYRVINGELSILGVEKGADLLLEHCQNINELEICGEKISVIPETKVSFSNLEIADRPIYRYKFDSLWFALNSENYMRFLNGELSLERQLANNIIEFFKMCGIWADKQIIVEGEFNSEPLIQKDTQINCFYGEFVTNVNLPDSISLGKRKSIGLGRIKKIA